MELVILFLILAALLFGPRRGGRPPSRAAVAIGAALLIWFLVAMAVGWSWRTIFGDLPQP